MKKVMNFKNFLNEMSNVQNIDDEFVQDDYVQDDYAQDEFVQGGESQGMDDEHEPEEIEDLIELIYNKSTNQWEYEGEMDLPSDFEVFYEWFIDEVSEDNTTASMKEEEGEVVFHIPEDLYVEFLEEIEKGVSDDDDDDYDDININVEEEDGFDIDLYDE